MEVDMMQNTDKNSNRNTMERYLRRNGYMRIWQQGHVNCDGRKWAGGDIGLSLTVLNRGQSWMVVRCNSCSVLVSLGSDCASHWLDVTISVAMMQSLWSGGMN